MEIISVGSSDVANGWLGINEPKSVIERRGARCSYPQRIIKAHRKKTRFHPLPRLNGGEDIPSGSGKVVLVPLAL